jgi:ribonucleoside-diphosphate reductase alpha chain
VNMSVRLSDEFMRKAERGDEKYDLKSPATGEVLGEIYASDILDKITEGTHVCGDPGVQYEDTIHKWHTVKQRGPITRFRFTSRYKHYSGVRVRFSSQGPFWPSAGNTG